MAWRQFLRAHSRYTNPCAGGAHAVASSPDGAVPRPVHHGQGHNMGEPSIVHLRQRMQQVYENQNQALKIGRRARQDMVSQYVVCVAAARAAGTQLVGLVHKCHQRLSLLGVCCGCQVPPEAGCQVYLTPHGTHR